MMQQQSLTPQGGVASLGNRQDMADKLANMGQFDDDQIAHVAEGEVIVPAPIMKYYPEIREQVFDVIRQEGLDPQEFVVGGDLVARNPQTGMQEFGFFSKVFKKIKKAFKKLAPIILPIVLPGIGTALAGMGGLAGGIGGFIGSLGAAGTAALGSGLGGLIQGRSFKDSLKMGALSGLTVGLMKGVGNVSKGKSFMADQFGAGTTPGFRAPGETGTVVPATVENTAIDAGAKGGFTFKGDPGTTFIDSPKLLPKQFTQYADMQGNIIPIQGRSAQGAFSYLKPSNIAKNLGLTSGPPTTVAGSNAALTAGRGAAETGFLSKVPDAFIPKNPSDLASLTGTGLIAAGLLTGEEEGDGRNLVDYEPYEPEGGVFTGLGYNPETGRFENVRVIRPTDFERAAAGGAISGPGTGTSDSIPAMLSDGEFVMTAKAVRGMGDGSRKKGAAKMYQMMNKLESMA
tara:strand:+ start:1258 stop:2628 length:1371 start_codon:yes stop_codon:yes gene_type:complete